MKKQNAVVRARLRFHDKSTEKRLFNSTVQKVGYCCTHVILWAPKAGARGRHLPSSTKRRLKLRFSANYCQEPYTWFAFGEMLLKGDCFSLALTFLDKATGLLPPGLHQQEKVSDNQRIDNSAPHAVFDAILGRGAFDTAVIP